MSKLLTGQDIFDTLNTYLKEAGLSWKQCVGICTDGARLTFHSLLFHTVICFNAFFNATYTVQLNLCYFIHLFEIQKHHKIDSILLWVPQTIYLFHRVPRGQKG